MEIDLFQKWEWVKKREIELKKRVQKRENELKQEGENVLLGKKSEKENKSIEEIRKLKREWFTGRKEWKKRE